MRRFKMNSKKNMDFKKVFSNKKVNYLFLELLILLLLILIYNNFPSVINECFIYNDISNIEKEGHKLSSINTSFLLPSKTYDENFVYSAMHKMANTKITAEDGMKWGSIAINKKNINLIKSIVEKIDYRDRPYLLSVLKRWGNYNFEFAPEEHNYFWEMLGGTVGRAVSNNDE
jgi:hypothetical protein